MSAVPHTEHIPKSALIGAAILVGLSLLLAAVVRLSGMDIRSLPAPQPATSVQLKFFDEPGGAVRVVDATSGRALEVLAPGTNGFLRALMRNLAHERRRRGIGDSMPFRLFSRTDGRLVLEDPATSTQIELEAFGATNANVFARFLGDTR